MQRAEERARAVDNDEAEARVVSVKQFLELNSVEARATEVDESKEREWYDYQHQWSGAYLVNGFGGWKSNAIFFVLPFSDAMVPT